MTTTPNEGRKIQSIRDLDLAGRRLFLRVDFNVPLENGEVTDATRIKEAMPTIEHALNQGAFVVLASHLGRPKGKKKQEYSMEPVAARVAEMFDCEVLLADDCVGDAARKVIADLREGQIAMLENLRFHPGEESDDESFAREMAKPVDLYVNDAFGAAHRAHASVHALPLLMKEKAMGLLMERELTALAKLRDQPEPPYVAALGGAKVSDKISVIEKLLESVHTLLIGGAMANTFLAAKGISVGKSRVENDKLALARSLLERADLRNVQVFLPEDVVVADHIDAAAGQVVKSSEIPDQAMALDIGPETVKTFREKILRANTVFWNGPMGLCEKPAFAKGTIGIGEALRDCRGYSVVGGGDSVAAINAAGLEEAFDHVSTGGGASLEFIEGRQLPGIQALASIK
ncbi:MAG: phosphoglycerate kinase [Deltaproteobacteria bacterium]|nr:phosphoglycerate kinase [Deltaproteobacteria bacterium]